VCFIVIGNDWRGTSVQEGKNYGDEYLAELDYIEVVEKLKEGYESDVVEDDSDSPSEEKGSTEARRSKGKLQFHFLLVYRSSLISLFSCQVIHLNLLT
jgi:hypothetical protein